MQYHEVFTVKVCLYSRISWENPNYSLFRSKSIFTKEITKNRNVFHKKTNFEINPLDVTRTTYMQFIYITVTCDQNNKMLYNMIFFLQCQKEHSYDFYLKSVTGNENCVKSNNLRII